MTCTDNDPTCDSNPTAGCVIRAQLCFNDAAASVYGGKCTASPVTAFALGGNPDAATVEAGASLEARQAAQAQVTRSWASVHPFGSGRVFQNFADPDLEDWPQAYYGPNLERLMRVKERHDPENVFRSEQSLGSLR